ncbi:MAG TPA: DUF2897 family protein [Steroidobacteraceae bacterium]|jgi:hypothetical protein|nr:DUF2897 family protein [Steroidobacteraceae bacterium]
MFKAIVIIILVIAALLGGLLALRNSRTGMPDEDVLKRAAERAREQAAKDDAER